MPQLPLTFRSVSRIYACPAPQSKIQTGTQLGCVRNAYDGNQRSLFYLLRVLDGLTRGGWDKTVDNLNPLLESQNLGTLHTRDHNNLTWRRPDGTEESKQTGATPPGLHASHCIMPVPRRRTNAWAKLHSAF